MIQWIKNNTLLFLIITTLIMLFVNLGVLQTNIMEARNIISAREMVEQGNWIFTTLNGLPRYEKPPLPTWITAFFGSIFGFENIFWLRIPVVLITLLLVYFFHKIASQLNLSKQQVVNSSLILITSFYVFFAGRDNNWDMYTHSFMLVSIFFLIKEFQSIKFNFLNFTVAFFFLGCSIMSKGPVSLYALFLPFLLAYFFTYTKKIKRNISVTLLTLIVGCIIGFTWILYVRYFDTDHFIAASKKEINSWQNHNTRPFYYYWSFFTQSGLWTIPSLVSLIYPYLKNKVSNKKAYKFIWLWTMFSVVLLSLIPEKKSRYLLPVLIPLALNTGFYIEYLILEFKNLNSKTEKSITNIIFGLYGIIAFAISIGVFIYTKNEFANYAIWTIPFSIITFFLGLLIIKGLKTKSFDQIFYSSILLMSTFVIFGFPLSKVTFSEQLYVSTSSIKELEKKYNITTYETDGFVPEIVLDYGKPIPVLSENGKIYLPKTNQFGLLANKNDSAFIVENLNKYSIKKIGEVNLNHSLKEQKNYNDRIQKDYFLVQLK